jgi:peptide subunit release factor 1 (eRF1)
LNIDDIAAPLAVLDGLSRTEADLLNLVITILATRRRHLPKAHQSGGQQLCGVESARHDAL